MIINAHPDLNWAITNIYLPSGFRITEPQIEIEGSDYAPYAFMIDTFNVRFRVAKITPKKQGLFVGLWRRGANNRSYQPYDISDGIDFIVISVRSGPIFGQFIFPVRILLSNGIISRDSNGGKLGIRVYPPWAIAESTQARKTQEWQTRYFLPVKDNDNKVLMQCRRLFKVY